MKYFIVAGEASGDLHGSNLMKGLYANDPKAEIRFWGGGLMRAVHDAHESGTGLLQDYRDGAVMGFVHVVMHLRKFGQRLNRCKSQILDFRPDVVILIDYPGFNFKIAEFAHKKGFKVFYYIAPKLWASRESRIKKLRAHVDRLFIIFPFEIEYFTKKAIPFTYKGNPLLDAIDSSPAMNESREDFLRRCGLPDKPSIALLAGSRNGEIKGMMPCFMQAARMMREMPEYADYQFIIAAAPGRGKEDYEKFFGADQDYVKVVTGESYSVVRHSCAAAVNSGTASLETALLGTPQVVAYNTSPVNFKIAKQIIKVDMISLGNLILGRLCFRELLQYYFTPENLVWELRRLIEDAEYRQNMLDGYAEIRRALGGSGASKAVAKAMIEELG